MIMMNSVNIREHVLMLYLIIFLSTYYILHGFTKLFVLLVPIFITIVLFFSRDCSSIRCIKVLPISFNICGFLIPLLASLINMSEMCIDLLGFGILLLLSIAIASFHTFISTRYVLVNIVRYCLTYTIISYAIFWRCEWFPYVLPFSNIIGIVLGSDIIPFIFLSTRRKNEHHMVIDIGGAKEADAIVISSLISYLSILIYRFLI